MTDQRVTIEIEAACPEELPLPTTAVKWWITSPGMTCLIRIEGLRGDVRSFVAEYWGDEIAYGGPDDDPLTYDVSREYAVDTVTAGGNR